MTYTKIFEKDHDSPKILYINITPVLPFSWLPREFNHPLMLFLARSFCSLKS